VDDESLADYEALIRRHPEQVSEEVRRGEPMDEQIAECWWRLPAGDDECSLRGVEVARWREESVPFDWTATVWAREFFRLDSLGLELKQRVESAILAVPGVTSADNGNWETWNITGKASGEAICRAVADVVDELADRMRAADPDEADDQAQAALDEMFRNSDDQLE
jgi:hypothetical protein